MINTADRPELILGVGGGISAYKSCELLRRLQDLGYNVTVIPTRNSLNFIGMATWEALTARPVLVDLWQHVHSIPHVKLAKQATVFLIAPATADLIARLAQGRADDLLTATALTSTCPKILVPAMHTEMLANPATLANLELLRSRGFIIVPPESGALTSGDFGPGRYPETVEILKFLPTSERAKTSTELDLAGKKILVSAGGTKEAIDAVRFIGNSSSGKQGLAVAAAAAARGGDVSLVIAGSSESELTERGVLAGLSGVRITYVQSALQMQQALAQEFPNCDLLVMSAAVADKRPAKFIQDKLSKSELGDIELVDNPDIVADFGASKTGQFIITFAAQAGGDLLALGEAKMKAKRADLMYVNDVAKGAIFGQDQTKGWILQPGLPPQEVSQLSKRELSEKLLDIYLASAAII
jgi:phosphopantothenoylcysteine decarboxylase/phosphopantothenate--cysteine ligase